MGFSRFPRKKKINWIEVQTPPCLHTFRKVYVSIGSCQWCPPQSIHFRFNTPTNNTFPASGTHTCLILRGYPPISHTFLAKSEGVNPPPLMFIHYQKCRIHPPPTPEPVGVGDSLIYCFLIWCLHTNKRRTLLLYALGPSVV